MLETYSESSHTHTQQQGLESPTVTHLACKQIQGTLTPPDIHPQTQQEGCTSGGE